MRGVSCGVTGGADETESSWCCEPDAYAGPGGRPAGVIVAPIWEARRRHSLVVSTPSAALVAYGRRRDDGGEGSPLLRARYPQEDRCGLCGGFRPGRWHRDRDPDVRDDPD